MDPASSALQGTTADCRLLMLTADLTMSFRPGRIELVMADWLCSRRSSRRVGLAVLVEQVAQRTV